MSNEVKKDDFFESENTEATVTENKDEKPKKQAGIKKDRLVGCEVRLDPTKSGMLMDNTNSITFSFIEGGISNLVVKENHQLDLFMRNIIHGILRVYKDGKDVTEKFGGPPVVDMYKPIVSEGIPRLDESDQLDSSLAQVLNTNDLPQLERYIDSISDFQTLDRLYKLEIQGNNPCSCARDGVLKRIEKQMKTAPAGAGGVYEDHSEDEKIIMR